MTTTSSAQSARLSDNGRAVLRLLARATSGSLTFADLRMALHRPDVSSAVLRASLSRTLRRLWRARLVELTDDRGEPLTTRVEAIRRWAERVQADPAGAYQVYLKHTTQPGRFMSAEAYAQAYLEHAGRVPEIRVASVRLTPDGASIG